MSRRQFEIGYDLNKSKYYIICVSKINFTEFLVTEHKSYPVTNGTIIGFNDQIYFEIKGLDIEKQAPKQMNTTDSIKQDQTHS
jgi:hypothetical protein